MNKRMVKKSLKKALMVIAQLGRSPYMSKDEDWEKSQYSLADKVIAGICNTCFVHKMYGLQISKVQLRTLQEAAQCVNYTNMVVFSETHTGGWRDDLLEQLSEV